MSAPNRNICHRRQSFRQADNRDHLDRSIWHWDDRGATGLCLPRRAGVGGALCGGRNRVHGGLTPTPWRCWSYDFGALATALAVNENSVVIAGSGQLQRVSRDLGARQWTANATLNSPIMGGPLITNDRILVVAQDGPRPAL